VDFPSCADVDKNFSAPQLNKTVTPKLSDAAKKAKKYGWCGCWSRWARMVRCRRRTALGGEPELTTAATDAVKQYKFTPYMRCGQAVEFQKVVVVPFAPPANPGDGAILPTK
jgi:hypothetical protein